jgi:hypothetical protein
MSGYKGPRGPNVSQYIANLNQLSPPQDMLADPQPVSEDFSAFLNTDFFDINGGTGVDLNAPIDFDVDFDAAHPAGQPAETSPSTITPAPKNNMEFTLNGKSTCRACCVLHLLPLLPGWSRQKWFCVADVPQNAARAHPARICIVPHATATQTAGTLQPCH